MWSIVRAGEEDLAELLALMRAYCDFYRVGPSDESLLALARALLADPTREGLQLLGRDGDGVARGFATLYWSWSTAAAARIGVMNDLFVSPHARRRGLAERLIGACVEECRRAGAVALEWQTAPDNVPAQALYERVGGRREDWICYSLAIGGGR
jgi:ribosomal protein S18 acetylase RimI-like enzyme